MRTALAADEPERERPALRVIRTSTTSMTYPYTTIDPFPSTSAPRVPPITTATFPQQIIGPWQCPECKVWLAPHVREHRCS